MEALLTYLRETRTTPKAFANLIGVDVGQLERMLVGEEPIEVHVARRMVDATGGALILQDLTVDAGCEIVDLRSRFSEDAVEIDVARLSDVLSVSLPDLIGGARRKGDQWLPKLAAEAVASTYAALSTITTRSGADRLAQALRPVFAEILEEMSAPSTVRSRLDAASQAAAELYFQAHEKKRRA